MAVKPCAKDQVPMSQNIDPKLAGYIEQAKADAVFAFAFLRESGTLSASLIFGISHRVPDHDALVSFKFPAPWSRNKDVGVSISPFSEAKDSVLNEPRLDADTAIHAHT